MAVRKPKQVKVVGQTFQVTFHDTLVSEDDGQKIQGDMSSQEGRIRVKNSRPFVEVDTLIHEIFHALEYKVGLEHNEYWVHRIATGFTQVLKDNPAVVRYIIERLKEEDDERS